MTKGQRPKRQEHGSDDDEEDNNSGHHKPTSRKRRKQLSRHNAFVKRWSTFYPGPNTITSSYIKAFCQSTIVFHPLPTKLKTGSPIGIPKRTSWHHDIWLYLPLDRTSSDTPDYFSILETRHFANACLQETDVNEAPIMLSSIYSIFLIQTNHLSAPSADKRTRWVRIGTRLCCQCVFFCCSVQQPSPEKKCITLRCKSEAREAINSKRQSPRPLLLICQIAKIIIAWHYHPS